MDALDTSRIIELLSKKDIKLLPGLNDDELKHIEQETAIVFPEDYRQLLKMAVPYGKVAAPQGMVGSGRFPDWKNNPINEINTTKDYIKNAFKFDIENSHLWLDEFGTKPSNLDDAVHQALELIEKMPNLIPVYSHRFIASSPTTPGNPIFSMAQPVDTIIYGSNLLEYFEIEFGDRKYEVDIQNIKVIPFWSNLLELNN